MGEVNNTWFDQWARVARVAYSMVDVTAGPNEDVKDPTATIIRFPQPDRIYPGEGGDE